MSSEKKHVLLSIKPQYAKLIVIGLKTIELRTKVPELHNGDTLAFYESSPVKMVTFIAEVDKVIVAKPELLWEQYHESLGLSKQVYDDYFYNREFAYGIQLRSVTKIQPISLSSICGEATNAPQSFRYLSSHEYQMIEHLAIHE